MTVHISFLTEILKQTDHAAICEMFISGTKQCYQRYSVGHRLNKQCKALFTKFTHLRFKASLTSVNLALRQAERTNDYGTLVVETNRMHIS